MIQLPDIQKDFNGIVPKNKIILGDCLKIMPFIEDDSIDLVLCDLPYCSTECGWDSPIPLKDLWEQYHRIVKKNGAILLFGQEPFTSKLVMSNPDEFKYRWTWEKSKASGYFHAKQQPLRASEDIAVFYRSQPTYNPQFTYADPYNKGTAGRFAEAYGARGKATEIKSDDGKRYPRSVIYFKTAESEGKTYHPTQKPLELISYLIKTYTNEGDTVLDNAAGSFTTAVAAQALGRNWIAIDQEEKYCEAGLERLNALGHEKE